MQLQLHFWGVNFSSLTEPLTLSCKTKWSTLAIMIFQFIYFIFSLHIKHIVLPSCSSIILSCFPVVLPCSTSLGSTTSSMMLLLLCSLKTCITNSIDVYKISLHLLHFCSSCYKQYQINGLGKLNCSVDTIWLPCSYKRAGIIIVITKLYWYFIYTSFWITSAKLEFKYWKVILINVGQR